MNKTKKHLILCVFVIMHFNAYAQKSLSLGNCYKIAEMKSDSTYTRANNQLFRKRHGIIFSSLGKYYKIAEIESDSTSIRNNNQSIRERHGIMFSEPRKFKQLNVIQVDSLGVEGNLMTSAYGPIYISDDRECVVKFPYIVNPIKYNEDEINTIRLAYTVNKALNPKLYPADREFIEPKGSDAVMREIFYEYVAANNISRDKRELIDINNIATRIDDKKVLNMFNADSLIICDIPIEKPYKGIYTNCVSMVIGKKNRPRLNFKWYFTDKGKNNKEEYFSRLSHAVWYEEEKEE